MALTDKLTNIADAIRGKTGKTEPLTLDGMATAIAGIQAGGGGDYTNPWASYETVEIEIGENTITNCKDAKTFMQSASGFDTIDSFVLLDNVTVTNQLIFKLTGSGTTCYRYRNGIGINNAEWNNNQYDAALVPGTRYLVRKLTLVNTNAPY